MRARSPSLVHAAAAAFLCASLPVTPPPTTQVPTLSEWAMIVMALLLVGTAFVAMRGRDA
jgi:hypothetical protein